MREKAQTKKHRILLRQQSSWSDTAGASKFRPKDPNRIITMKELRSHNDLNNEGWMAVNNIVYDVTRYCAHHPGGIFDLSKGVGDDCTDLFNEFHSWINPSGFIGRFRVGRLKPLKNKNEIRSSKKLHKLWVPLELFKVQEVSSFTYLFSFVINDKGISLSLIWQKICPFHVLLKTKVNNKVCVRPLSPLNLASNLPENLKPYKNLNLNEEHLHLVIKLYDKGHLSKMLSEIKENDQSLTCAFIKSHLSFNKNILNIEGMRGNNKIQGKFNKICFISAGTGILPVLQVIQYLIHFQALDSKPETDENNKIFLIYSISSLDTSICDKFLCSLSEQKKIKCTFVVSKLDEDNEKNKVKLEKMRKNGITVHESSFNSKFLMKHKDCLPDPEVEKKEEVRILLCGPPGCEEYGPMDNKKNRSIRRVLMRNGWSSEQIENFN